MGWTSQSVKSSRRVFDGERDSARVSGAAETGAGVSSLLRHPQPAKASQMTIALVMGLAGLIAAMLRSSRVDGHRFPANVPTVRRTSLRERAPRADARGVPAAQRRLLQDASITSTPALRRASATMKASPKSPFVRRRDTRTRQVPSRAFQS